jgi:transcriptional regulator with XRE-family HTH domain
MGLAQSLARNLRRLRQAQGVSQEALADAAGLAPTYVGQLERGQRNPTLAVVERLAAQLGVDPLELLAR